MKKIFLIASIILLCGCKAVTPPQTQTDTVNNQSATSTPPTTTIQIANPASVNCTKTGGKLVMREETGGTAGYCIFKDGTECEEWKYYRGECYPTYAKPTIKDFDDCVKAGNPVMESYPRQCKDKKGTTYTEVIKPSIPSKPSSSNDIICTTEYKPVCAMIQVQCITTPCNPIPETISNRCELKKRGTMVLEAVDGKCEKELSDTCLADSDCKVPGQYAVMSVCPYEVHCLAKKCVVTCPQSHATQ